MTPAPYMGFLCSEGRNAAGNENGYAKVWRQSHLEERISREKKPLLLAQVEKCWKEQGCTVGAERTGNSGVSVSAACADKATVVMSIGKDGVASVRAQVDRTKFRSGGNPFPDTQSPLPAAERTPAGQQDHPYWSH